MFANWCRKYFGGIRLALTVIVLLFCLLVIVADLFPQIEAGAGIYTLLGGIIVQVTAFVWKETERKTGGENEPKL